MKILVFSDSHQRSQYMREAIEKHLDAGGIDCIFYLGDGVKDLERLSLAIPVCYVDGNYEEYVTGYLNRGSLRPEITIDLYGFRFFLTHGHRYGVKGGLDPLIAAAKSTNADVLLFGHTHERYYTYLPPEDDETHGLYILNPGSISKPRDGSFSYAVISIEGKNILFSHGTI